MADFLHDLHIPAADECDAYYFQAERRNVAPAGEKPGIGVKTPKLISPPPAEKMTASIAPITEVYDRLKMKWSWTKIWWDTDTERKASLGHTRQYCDPLNSTVITKKGKSVKGTGVVLYCDPKDDSRYDRFTAIDLDGDNEYTLRVRELIGDSCNMVAKTRKGNHYIFRYTDQLAHTASTEKQIDIRNADADGILYAEPASYQHPQYGFIAYKWEKIPAVDEGLVECPVAVVKYLQSVGYNPVAPIVAGEKKPKQRKKLSIDADITEFSIADVMEGKIPEELMEVNGYCCLLTPKWLNERENWYRFGLCLRGISDSSNMRELFVAHSARADAKYDTAEAREANRRWFDGEREKGKINLGSLQYWAKSCSPAEYFKKVAGEYMELLKNGGSSSTICEIFAKEMAGDMVYSSGGKCYYEYDKKTKLWCGGSDKGNNSRVYNKFVRTLQDVIIRLVNALPPAEDEEATKKKQETTKMLMKVWAEVDGRNAITMVDNFLPAMMMPEEDPYKFFNQNKGLLPLNNCVWDFEKCKAIPYQREHYFTFKIPINYDPDADTSLMERAMNDWFKSNTEVIDFIQFYIGYLLTGETTRQDMMGVWGSSAGNGKSLLWGEIVPLLLGGKDGYYAKITSEAFTSFKSGDTNDQIYSLNGKRFAFLSEPRKRFDTNMIKELTGDQEYTVSAKYKGSITFNLMVKFVMAFNDVPDIDLNENGMNRRFNCVEQNKEFKTPEAYDALHEDQKPFYGKQDEKFVKELLENREGLMLWALRGATEYMKNKKRSIPEAMKATKQKACGEVDILGNWCRRFLKCDESTNKQKLKVADLKKRWAEDKLNFGQNEKSFVRTFLARIKTIIPGCDTDEGRPGKGEAKLINVRVLTAEEADEEEEQAEQ